MGEPLSVPPEFDALPIEEKIDFVQRLWARIATGREEVPSPAWHARTVSERLDEFERTGHRGRTWEEFRADLRSRRTERNK
jgi:putative addiction module component (TIGR02574 family)